MLSRFSNNITIHNCIDDICCLLYIGFLFWIDYMVDPDAPPPALITTVKPVPINPKQIWEADKSPDLERNLIEVETSAIEYLTAREEKVQDREVDKALEDSDSENESIFGEFARKIAEKKVKKQKKRSTKSDVQFVMHAVANIKAAVKFMVDIKIKSNVVSSTSKRLTELTYEKVFTHKTVTTDDMQYYAARTTTESILNNIQIEIDKLPEFEWFQKSTLSEEQLRLMELQQVVLVEQATAIRDACNKVLVRRRESTDRETISRLTNEMQRREEAKAIEKQYKEEQKEAERERKQAERVRKEQDKEAEKLQKKAAKERKDQEKEDERERKLVEREKKREEKEASKAVATTSEKKKRSRQATSPPSSAVLETQSIEQEEEGEDRENNYRQSEESMEVEEQRSAEPAAVKDTTEAEVILELSNTSSSSSSTTAGENLKDMFI